MARRRQRGRARVASRFVASDGAVARYERHDTLPPAALAAAGLTMDDEARTRRTI
jgi:hypothetical protein